MPPGREVVAECTNSVGLVLRGGNQTTASTPRRTCAHSSIRWLHRGRDGGGIRKNPACGHTLPFLDWLFPSSSSSSWLWKKSSTEITSQWVWEWVARRQTVNCRQESSANCQFVHKGLFFIPPSLPRPQRDRRRGMKKKTHSEVDTQELQHTKHRLHVCQVTLCSQRASAPQECTGKQTECALGLSCF